MTFNEYLIGFVDSHPQGWDHDAWIGLLESLKQEGQDVSDPDRVGLALENERLLTQLRRSAVPGFGPKRTQAVVERFGTLWSLSQASVDDVASVPGIHRRLAEELVNTL